MPVYLHYAVGSNVPADIKKIITEGQTDGHMDRQTDGQKDRRTGATIELLSQIKI